MAEDKFDELAQRFTSRAKEAFEKHEVLSARDESLIKELRAAAESRLKTFGVLSASRKNALQIKNGRTSAFNVLAKKLHDEAGTKILYHLKFLFEHPYASASFDRQLHVLYLPHAAISIGDAKDLAIRHELVHVYVQRDLERGIPGPYYGFLKGEDFKPDDLYLDEMKAYSHDLQLALDDLNKILKDKDFNKEALAGARIKKIYEKRSKGEPRLPDLNPLEQIWDRIVSKRMFGEWHTVPVIKALDEIFATPSVFTNASFKVVNGIPRGIMKFEASDKIHLNELDVALLKNDSTENQMNTLKNQVTLILNTAKNHQETWDAIRKQVESILNTNTNEAKFQKLLELSETQSSK